ncbi:MAG: NAD(P)-dependent glycerol-1-phosphate dehydrogenase [Candidatus Undinarchaeales archaeon]|jgi:glycerol-1-phosphate dehydrogenase [NAD(P)+]|nr:NAD(P)-dependent glycerol-1-phosphate dehydrogenase [Candidatus Undinarchaeales archaeon]
MVNQIEFPRKILLSEGGISQTGEVASEFAKEKNALIVSNEGLMDVVGNNILKNLEDSGFSVSTYFTLKATPESIQEAQERIKQEKASIVLGVGGGTCIDVAKLSSFNEQVPFISVPTAPSHDGLNSPVASIKTEDGSKSFPARAPVAIIADLSVIASAPPRFLPSGCGDIVSNFTAVEDWKLAHKEKGESFDKYSSALSLMGAEVILDNADLIAKRDIEGLRLVVHALISAGSAMCIAGSSRPCSGAEHLFSHTLDKLAPKPAMHGEQCGVGSILTAHLQGLDWEKFRDVLKKIGTPTTAKELGIAPEIIVKALSTAHEIRDRYTILGSGISEEKAQQVAQDTGVI